MSEEYGVRKISYMVPISEGILMDEGLIPDTRPPVRISRWRRLRWRLADRIESARLRVGARIAGVDPEDWQP